MARTYFNVRPRYSAGSPAMVNEATALRVVNDERQAYEYTMSGARSPDAARQAALEGLDGIVEEVTERADCWLVTDLITSRQFIRMFPSLENEARRKTRAFRLRAKYHRDVEGMGR